MDQLELRRLAGKNFAKTNCQIFQALWSIATALFGHHPAGVPDLINGFHDGRPVIVPLEQGHLKSFPKTFFFAALATVFFDVEFLNTLSQKSYPLLGPAIGDHVADIEMPTHCWTV